MIVGIATGLGAALFQSLSYLATRQYVHGRGKWAPRQLLILGHVWMGIASAVLLVLVWPKGFSPVAAWEPLLDMVVFYLAGQISITLALRHIEASRASPLQGIKIIFLAAMAAFFPQPTAGGTGGAGGVGLTWMQWAGVILSVAAAASLNYSGKAIPRKVLMLIVIGCASYAVADWNIARTNAAISRVVPTVGPAQVSLLNSGLCYGITGVLGAVMAPLWGSRRGKDWSAALPFAGAWFMGMVFLYWSYAEVGPVLGAILQSTRGLMSILMGTLFVYWGHLHIEPLSGRGIFLRRLASGALMFMAVSLYVIREPGRLTMKPWHSSNTGAPWKKPLIAGTNCLPRGTSARSA